MKKFSSRRGFTLTEMLIAVLLLAFVSALVAVMTTGVLSTTITMQEVAQAEILGNEILDNMRRELRFGINIEVNPGASSANMQGNVTYDYDDNNRGYSFAIVDGMVMLQHTKTTTTPKEEGEKEEQKIDSNPLFGGTSYGKNLRVSQLNFSTNEAKDSVNIFVEVSYGNNALWSSNISVKPLNGKITVSA